MKATNIKGALLEYIVRNLLKNCGFTNVKADNVYSFERSGLFFVNGKGMILPIIKPLGIVFKFKSYAACSYH